MVTYVLTPVSSDSKAPVVVVIVPRGATDRRIGEILENDGLIRRALGFLLAARIEGVNGKMVAGTYEFSPSMTPRAMAVAIALGRTADDELTIPEGYTVRQIGERLAEKQMADERVFLSLALTQGRTFTVNGFTPPSVDLEGYLFPDTYTIPHGTPERGIIEMMLNEFAAHALAADGGFLASHPQKIAPTVKLASLVEREAEVESDRPKIAAALLNRLRRGMRLECDASVEYGLPTYKTRLYYKDLKIDTPYNTYLHPGLPPTPIANPGMASIEAALHPAQVSYLYYVARDDGSHTHIFSDTLAEHKSAIARIRALEVGMRRSGPAKPHPKTD